jgi:hypothetical protein
MLQAVPEEADHSEIVSQLKGELRDSKDDFELRETLLKSSKVNVGLLEGQLAALKGEVEKKEKALAEWDELFKAEKKKVDFNVAKLMESAGEVAQLKAQVIKLLSSRKLDMMLTAKLSGLLYF